MHLAPKVAIYSKQKGSKVILERAKNDKSGTPKDKQNVGANFKKIA